MTEPLVLGIDIGGTNTAFGMVNRRGEIVVKGTLPTTGHDSVADYITALKNELLPVMDRVGATNIKGAGIGAPNGNFFTGEIAFAPNLPWKGVIPLARLVGESLHLKATLTNDANAAAIGEMMYGAAKGMKDFIVVTLGTGVGSGFVANGEVIYGSDGFAGELGHVIAIRDGRRCGCGRNGCLETYTSATGVARTAELLLEETNEATVLRTHKGKVTARMVQEAAVGGDAVALHIFDYTAKILGQTLADAVAITSPEAIIFFGGLARAGDLLLKPVQRYMEDSMLHIYKNKVKIMQSALPDADAAILGASALAW
jgi:glucokinase